ncbi:MAG: hypothetical protein RIR77_904 [Planctomycetota bacterium]
MDPRHHCGELAHGERSAEGNGRGTPPSPPERAPPRSHAPPMDEDALQINQAALRNDEAALPNDEAALRNEEGPVREDEALIV